MDFLLQILAGLVVALILEWLKWRSAKAKRSEETGDAPTGEVVSSPQRAAAGDDWISTLASMLRRMVLALVIGFFGSGFLAGAIEAAFQIPIANGSPSMMRLFAVITAVAWILIADRDRRRGR